jgi:hypothetical protein
MGTVVHNGIHHQSHFYHIYYMSYFVSQCLVFCIVFYTSLFVILSYFFWQLHCLFFSNLRLLITPLVSSNFPFSYLKIVNDILALVKWVLISQTNQVSSLKVPWNNFLVEIVHAIFLLSKYIWRMDLFYC